ncbi:MAG: diaminopimelate decarboxylase [Chitinispirillaceae bacterium]|nr:diaminopimelate decarboxylase [Chitinispirillaceae bacterium]
MDNLNTGRAGNDVGGGTDFFGTGNPSDLAKTYGTPLYVYSEVILRQRCRELTRLVTYGKFKVNYSAKANTNLSLLRIIREEGLLVDAMSPGEIFIELKAGFRPEEILFISNNVSAEEMRYAVKTGVTVSVDSVSQLEQFGKMFRGSKVAIRINPGVGAGHHEKVITGGKNTKFGVDPVYLDEVQRTLSQYNLHLAGINQHIGSLFMTPETYLEAAGLLLDIADHFPDLDFVDFGGGFGIPYHKQDGEVRLDLKDLGNRLQRLIDERIVASGKHLTVKVEPGRYTVAECGILLGRVHSVKMNGGKKYIGTDIGFNVLARPVLYDAYHEIEVYGVENRIDSKREPVTVVGNICETGDVLAKDRILPEVMEGDVLGILDAGAYGMVMSSNYNCRLRPAEVLINREGKPVLIRRHDTLEDLVRHFDDLES